MAFLLSLARRNFTRRNFRSLAACRLFSASSSSDPLADVSLGAGKLSSGGGSPPFSPDFTDLGPSFVGLAGKLKTLAACPSEKVSSPFSHGIPKYALADAAALVDPSVVLIKLNTNNGGFGSGFFVDRYGMILTCAHVVIDPYYMENTEEELKLEKVSVYVGSNIFLGDVVAYNRHLDVALVKITTEKNDFPHVNIDASTNHVPGEFVMTIGSPYVLRNTHTAGIISTMKQSNIQLQMTLDPNQETSIHIVTTCFVAGGCSGGPLVTLDGSVIGVTTNTISRLKETKFERKHPGRESVGLGIAVPIENAIAGVIDQVGEAFLKK